VCLQETNIPPSYINNFHSYSLYQSSQLHTEGHPCVGVASLIRNNIRLTALTITSPSHVAAVRITPFRPIIVCSIYLPPHSNWNETDLLSITQQLLPPILFLGDLNAHNIMWGCANTNAKGKYVQSFLMENDFCLLNSNLPTFTPLLAPTVPLTYPYVTRVHTWE
jgi:Endonuclease-reverse transcriptase